MQVVCWIRPAVLVHLLASGYVVFSTGKHCDRYTGTDCAVGRQAVAPRWPSMLQGMVPSTGLIGTPARKWAAQPKQ